MTTPSKPDLVALADLIAAIEPLQDWTAQLHPKPEKYDRYVAVLTKDQRDAIVQTLRHLASQPSLYEAGLRDMRERCREAVCKIVEDYKLLDGSQTLASTHAEKCLAAISALPADGGEVDDEPNDQDEVLLAYGLLWCVSTTDKRVHAARRELLKCLDKDLQAKAISAARTTMALVRDIRQMKGATFASNFDAPASSGDAHGDGYCGCTERCKNRDNCQYDVKPATPSTAGSVREALEPFAKLAEWGDGKHQHFPQTGVSQEIDGMFVARPDERVILHLAPGCPSVTLGDLRRARVAYDALSAPVEAPVAVKPLTWISELNRPHDSPAWNAGFPDLGVFFRVFKAWWGDQDKWAYVYDGFYHTEQEAKAAAQADYEQRIRSALIATAEAPVAWLRDLPGNEAKPDGRCYDVVFVDPQDARYRPLYATTRPLPSVDAKSPADEIIGQIEERFPNWRGFRDLVDCIDCTLHDLRSRIDRFGGGV